MVVKLFLVWCNGKPILWSHLQALYKRDTEQGAGLRLLPKLKFEHVNLTAFSKMRVDLAAQVLSSSVSKALEFTGGSEVEETVKFTANFDKFFDALNVSNFTDGVHKRKPFQLPYRSKDDFRLKWLEDEFVPYLDQWQRSVEAREGYTRAQKKRMLLSDATILGLKITAKSFVELTRFLFTMPGVKNFLSQRICQDALEKFFGCQRQRGATHDNPNALEFLRNTQALRVVNTASYAVKGNCRGAMREKEEADKENQPLPKRRRKRK
jgi:hypothetical protein